jgi:hypothetical protein
MHHKGPWESPSLSADKSVTVRGGHWGSFRGRLRPPPQIIVDLRTAPGVKPIVPSIPVTLRRQTLFAGGTGGRWTGACPELHDDGEVTEAAASRPQWHVCVVMEARCAVL